MTENNNIEISPRDRRLVKNYERELEKNPDKAIEKTMKSSHLRETQVRTIIGEHSKYPTPSAYKKSIQDSKAIGNIVADKFNEEYAGLLGSNDLILTVKGLEARGIDVKGMFVEFLQSITHDGITEHTGDTLIGLGKNIPLRKTFKQEADDMEQRARIKGYEKKIKVDETDIESERLTQHIVKVGAQRITGKEQSDDRDFNYGEENIKYNKEYEEMYDELMGLVLEESIPHNRAVLELKKKQFQLKWGFRIPQAEELRQLKAKRERAIAENEIIQNVVELETFLDGLSTEELIELDKEVNGVI